METLELPSGETVTPEDVFLFGDYPYRFVPEEGDGFTLSPLYWGGGDMDIPFRDREALVEQWGGAGDRGTLTDEEWADWLQGARTDDRFDDRELDALAQELGVADAGASGDEGTLGDERSGLLARIRRWLSR